jgi:integrase
MPPFLSLARLGNERSFTVLQETARKRSRYGHRDDTMILVAYRHGLRASEVCGLRWGQIDLNSGRLHVRRAKGGIDNVHPLSGKEIRALRQLHRADGVALIDGKIVDKKGHKAIGVDRRRDASWSPRSHRAGEHQHVRQW